MTAAYATASNEVLLQHYGFVDTDNTNDVYTANILEFVEQNVIDQPNEEQLQDVHSKAALKTALTEVPFCITLNLNAGLNLIVWFVLVINTPSNPCLHALDMDVMCIVLDAWLHSYWQPIVYYNLLYMFVFLWLQTPCKGLPQPGLLGIVIRACRQCETDHIHLSSLEEQIDQTDL